MSSRGLSNHTRQVISQAAFLILVILIPLMAGAWWSDHQRTDDIAKIVRERRQLLIDSCERGNAVRAEFAKLVRADREQAALLIDYMRLDIAANRPSLNVPEQQALKRLVVLYRMAAAQPILPQVNCQLIK